MERTIKQAIIEYLNNYMSEWCFGGKLARGVHEMMGAKESTVERVARLMVNSGTLEKQLVQIEDQGARVVQYKLAEQQNAGQSNLLEMIK